MEKLITITGREYKALRAAAELAGHPEVMARTILAMRPSDRKISLEDAFPEVRAVSELRTVTAGDAAKAEELYNDFEGSHF